ncbi:glycosyl hydrolase [Pedobacter psychroterrae]|uniref:Glycoside hydrolase n=1 Tax=Pedobacter psychroterrae TaxID=2530453 RepID=A0A4R0NNK3_9SPHI|nr:glycosyl hydrolase [Pedobacter psychroterrae]TCD02520.1 glycoside hydrolase [Pedobacter psychroterrae]
MIKKTGLMAIIFLLVFMGSKAQQIWPKVEKEMRPWTRWWWMGSAVDKENINNMLNQYQQAGIGGVEITPIYGAKGFEKKYLQFLSPEWLDMLSYTINTANGLDMGVDMNTGTGWPFGGPQIKPQYAATKLIVQKYSLEQDKAWNEKITVKDAKQDHAILQALTAYGSSGEALDLLDKVEKDGTLNWRPAKGNWELYASFAGKTRQQVKRAAPGGAGFTLDHLNKEAVGVYLNRFDDAFRKISPGVRAFFNDSYEVYGANWTSEFFSEFKKLQGYDLSKNMKKLIEENKGDEVARIKSDYRETMSEMLLNNFTRNWTNWAHGYKSLSKNQAHGSPGNLLDLYSAVDIPECETFGSSNFPISGLRRDSSAIRNVDPDPIMFKFATSAAHTNGKKYVSSETFTWLTEHFNTSLSQAKPEVEQLFLTGVNHVFFHGTTYSPKEAGYPGWLFYASVNFTPSNSIWPHLKGMNEYITRVQSVLQSTKPDNEVLMYWPVYDVWHNPHGMDAALKIHDVDQWLYPTPFYKAASELTRKGYSLDFVSDKLIAKSQISKGLIITNENATPYQTLIVPKAGLMTVATLKSILDLAKQGANIIFQELPKDVPGLKNLTARRTEFKELISELKFNKVGAINKMKIGKGQVILAQDLAEALRFVKINKETFTDTGLQFTKRTTANNKYYYIVNHTAKDIFQKIEINEKSPSVLVMDPQTGVFGLAEASESTSGTQVKVQIKSGEAIILKTGQVAAGIEKWRYLGAATGAFTITTPWYLNFENGGPELPKKRKLKSLTSWTDLGDPKANKYSGTGSYVNTFSFDPKKGEAYVLDLGKVAESARVWLNGKDLGIVWSIPFQLRVTDKLKRGKNILKIDVANLMANRIKDMDQNKIDWRNYHEINFVNIDYKPFDASNWELMPSGLIGPVCIKSYK